MTATLTDDQITAVFERLLGMAPRGADRAVLKHMNPGGVKVEDVAAYIHDHWMGSPSNPSLAKVEQQARIASDTTP